MNIKILGMFIMISHITSSSYAINFKRLEMEADTYHHRILSGVASDEKMIRKSLCFLSDKDAYDEKYKQPATFNQFYENTMDRVKHHSFSLFSQTCKKMFEEEENEKNKAAIYLLLEKVSEKSLAHVNTLQRLQEFKRHHDDGNEKDISGSFDYFLNIDKEIKSY
ncbi:MAG: hypothetical protein K2P93_06795 [Alphaproteobacteria bacterium]|nr:hypothetical protein [Alphaproteobacteria bacterium]